MKVGGLEVATPSWAAGSRRHVGAPACIVMLWAFVGSCQTAQPAGPSPQAAQHEVTCERCAAVNQFVMGRAQDLLRKRVHDPEKYQIDLQGDRSVLARWLGDKSFQALWKERDDLRLVLGGGNFAFVVARQDQADKFFMLIDRNDPSRGALIRAESNPIRPLDVDVNALAARAAPVVDALEKYAHDHGALPRRLDDLVPDYLPKLPSSGFRERPEFGYFTWVDSSTLRLTWQLEAWCDGAEEGQPNRLWLNPKTGTWRGPTSPNNDRKW
jgi:hypothetical protein